MIRDNILFVCSEGLIRSPTAADMVETQPNVCALYCGINAKYSMQLNKQLLDWGDRVIVFGQTNRSKIRRKFKGYSHKITCWNIPDEFYPNQPELKQLIWDCWYERVQLSNPTV